MKRRTVLQGIIGGCVLATAGGCGTILHKERINRPRSRDLDWGIVALNGLGLLFFFVPGVIAFVVDFHTGAIYLPPEQVMLYPSDATAVTVSGAAPAASTVTLYRVPSQPARLDQAAIEAELSRCLSREIVLDEAARVSQIESLGEFDNYRQLHRKEATFGQSIAQFFRRGPR